MMSKFDPFYGVVDDNFEGPSRPSSGSDDNNNNIMILMFSSAALLVLCYLYYVGSFDEIVEKLSEGLEGLN